MIIPVTRYADLAAFAKHFASGDIQFLMITSSPGKGKSTILRNAAPEARLLAGHMSPIGLYMAAYESRESPIILDDIDSLYSDDNAVMLLKALCQTDLQKRVGWATASKVLRDREIPNEFVSSSPICILGNEWHTRNRNVAAIVDRAVSIDFEPSAEEVHVEAGKWFSDLEIYEYVGNILHEIDLPSFRLYVIARQLKRVGQDWRGAIATTFKVKPVVAKVASLLQSDAYASEADRIEAFIKQGGSRPTYFRVKKEILRNRETLRLTPEYSLSATYNKATSCLAHAT